MKKAVLFAMDFLVALSLFFVVIFSLGNLRQITESQSSRYMLLNSFAQDAITVLSETLVSEATDLETIQYHISQGDIGPEDMSKTLADVIGTFIVANDTAISQNISWAVLGDFLPKTIGYELFLNNVSFMNNSQPQGDLRISVETLLSGYDVNRSTEGYVARSWLKIARYNEKLLVTISPVGSGFEDPTCVRWHWLFWWLCVEWTNGGDLVINKTFKIPSDADEIKGAYLYYSCHSNGGNVRIYMNDILQFSDWVSGTYYKNITISDLTIGNNTLRIEQDEPAGYHTHTHPGLLLEVNYIKERRLGYFENRTIAQRIYLPEITGHPVAWGVFPFHISRNSTINEAKIHIEGEDVDDYYEVYVNSDRVARNTNPPFSPVIDLDISSYLHTQGGLASGETDTVSVYFDMESQKDYPTQDAAGNCTIKSTSYIFINYTKPEEVKKYGEIPMTLTEYFSPPAGNPKTVTWPVTDNEIIKAFLHIVQEYSWKAYVAVWHDPESPPTWNGAQERWEPTYMQIFASPTGRNIPSTLYIPLDRLSSNTNNSVSVIDSGGGNDILPNSSVEYVVLVPANVGYGEVFDTPEEAEDDARQRLQDILDPYQIQGTMEFDNATISGISWLWGPAELKVVLWI